MQEKALKTGLNKAIAIFLVTTPSLMAFNIGPITIPWTPPKEIQQFVGQAARVAGEVGKFADQLKPQWLKNVETAVGGFIGQQVKNVDQWIKEHDPLDKLIPDTEIRLWGDKTISGKDLKKGIRVAGIAGTGIVLGGPLLTIVGAPVALGAATYAVTGSLQETIAIHPYFALARLHPMHQQFFSSIIGKPTPYEEALAFAESLTQDKSAQQTLTKHIYPAIKAAQTFKNGDTFKLRSFYGKYPLGSFTAVNPKNPSDKKTMLSNNATVALQLSNGTYLSVKSNNMIGTSPSIIPASTWKLHALGPAVFVKDATQAQTRKIDANALIYNKQLLALQNQAYGGFISSNQVGNIGLQTELATQGRWQLENASAEKRVLETLTAMDALYVDAAKKLIKKTNIKTELIQTAQAYQPFTQTQQTSDVTWQAPESIKKTIPLAQLIKKFLYIKAKDAPDWVASLKQHVNTRFAKSPKELLSLEKFINRVKYYKEKRSQWFNKRFGAVTNDIATIIEQISQIDIPMMIDALNIELVELPADKATEWLNRANYVINKAKTEEDKVALKEFAESTEGYLKDFAEIANDIFGKNLTTLKTLITTAKNKARVKVPTKTAQVAQRKRIQQAKAKRKPTFLTALTTVEKLLENPTLGQSAQLKNSLLTNLTFLVDNRWGQPAVDVSRFKDLMEELDESYLNLPDWLAQFTENEQEKLLTLVDKGATEIDFAKLLSTVDYQMKRRELLRNPDTQSKWIAMFSYIMENTDNQEEPIKSQAQNLINTIRRWSKDRTWSNQFRIVNRRKLQNILKPQVKRSRWQTRTDRGKKRPDQGKKADWRGKRVGEKREDRDRRERKIVKVTDANFTQITSTINDTLLKAIQDKNYRQYWIAQIRELFKDPLTRNESQLQKLQSTYKRIQALLPEFKQDATTVANVLDQVTVNYEDILAQERKDIVNAARNEATRTIWLKKLSYLIDNYDKQTPALQSKFNELKATIESMKKYFPKAAQMQLDLLFVEEVPEDIVPELEAVTVALPKIRPTPQIEEKHIQTTQIIKPQTTITKKPVRTIREQAKRTFKKIRR